MLKMTFTLQLKSTVCIKFIHNLQLLTLSGMVLGQYPPRTLFSTLSKMLGLLHGGESTMPMVELDLFALAKLCTMLILKARTCQILGKWCRMLSITICCQKILMESILLFPPGNLSNLVEKN